MKTAIQDKHFIISFINYHNRDESYIIAEKEDVIYDTQKFDEILNLWKPYLEDFQSLFDYNKITYKTSPHIDFKRKDDFAKPFLAFVKQFTPLNNKYDCFTISFPRDIVMKLIVQRVQNHT